MQEAGLKVKEYELLRKNFADSGNFGKQLYSRCRDEHLSSGSIFTIQLGAYILELCAFDIL